jgi:23S rRNA (cytosine1962-C5)-methyltransferase
VTPPAVAVSARGAARWRGGHPWIYRSDIATTARVPAGVVRVVDRAGRFLGQALLSPASEIRLRRLTTEDAPIDAAWWRTRIAAALARRAHLAGHPTAYRVVHAEGDGLPSLIVDRYADVAVVQLLSAGLEAERASVLAAVGDVLQPRGLLLRNDASVRRHEHLPLEIVEAAGTVPETVAVEEAGVRYAVSLQTGQKTGAFLDQRENRMLLGRLARGRALDAFTYQGLFALHMAAAAETVLAADSSAAALDAARENAARNGRGNIEWREANAFDLLRALEREGRRFETVVLDPPAFAKQKSAVARALAGYKEINLRALRLLTRDGVLFTASCSFHVGRTAFLQMLADAAADSGRRVALERVTGQGADHPELLTVPETGYLKGAVLRVLE